MKQRAPTIIIMILLQFSIVNSKTFDCQNLRAFADGSFVPPPAVTQDASEPEVKTILEVETDKPRFIDRLVTLKGTLETSAKYVSSYDQSQETHYAFSLSDTTDGQTRKAYIYMKRGESAVKLRNVLLSKGGKLVGEFTVKILKDKYEDSSPILAAELIDYKASDAVKVVKPVNLPEPEYPKKARKEHVSDTVVVQVTIDEKGNVIAAHAISGNPLLQQAAVEAALKAKFSPTILEGQPVKVTGTINYNFSR